MVSQCTLIRRVSSVHVNVVSSLSPPQVVWGVWGEDWPKYSHSTLTGVPRGLGGLRRAARLVRVNSQDQTSLNHPRIVKGQSAEQTVLTHLWRKIEWKKNWISPSLLSSLLFLSSWFRWNGWISNLNEFLSHPHLNCVAMTTRHRFIMKKDPIWKAPNYNSSSTFLLLLTTMSMTK